MGTCFLYGNSGGGSNGLQFVSGSTEPANPSEGLIWVESSLAGKTCVVLISEPESPKEGLVWFNPVDYYSPAVCKVYTSSAWETVNAYIYSSGEWSLLCWDNVVLPNVVVGKFVAKTEGGENPTYTSDGHLTHTVTLSFKKGIKYTVRKTTSTLGEKAATFINMSSIDTTKFNSMFLSIAHPTTGSLESPALFLNCDILTRISIVFYDDSGSEKKFTVSENYLNFNSTKEIKYELPISSSFSGFYSSMGITVETIFCLEPDASGSSVSYTANSTYDVSRTIDISKIWFE